MKTSANNQELRDKKESSNENSTIDIGELAAIKMTSQYLIALREILKHKLSIMKLVIMIWYI